MIKRRAENRCFCGDPRPLVQNKFQLQYNWEVIPDGMGGHRPCGPIHHKLWRVLQFGLSPRAAITRSRLLCPDQGAWKQNRENNPMQSRKIAPAVRILPIRASRRDGQREFDTPGKSPASVDDRVAHRLWTEPNLMPAFARTIGIDYSGAETATAALTGLRVYLAAGDGPPVQVPPPPSSRRYWTRKGLAEWLVERLADDVATLVGIDHGFSFPLRYFEVHGLLPDWPQFLDDFQRHWPTDEDHLYVDFVRDGLHGDGAARMGDARWRRLTEQRAGRAKSVFHFDVPGSVAKSTHAGIPWLRFIRQRAGDRVHFWPFDGWDIPAGRSAIAEVYPALWSRGFANEGRTGDQHDAFSIVAWLSRADGDGRLAAFLKPDLSPPNARWRGWRAGYWVFPACRSEPGRKSRVH
jgi:hypothetical protein